MPQTEYALISNFDEELIPELRKRGITVTKAYLGDWGYTTDEQIDYVVEAINNLMHDPANWTPIIWDQLEPEAQRQLMLLAADSDTFMEKARLPAGYGYEDQINRILGLCQERASGEDDRSIEDQAPPQT